jgi:Fur family ferric uptake transcriptional regulator
MATTASTSHGHEHGHDHDAEHSHKHQHAVSPSDVAHQAATRLSAAGQRFTPNRQEIVAALAATDRPLSIPEILVATPELAQSSAYRNLSVLEDAGVVTRVVTTDEWARYELSEDITGHHHHLVCNKCGAVDDIRVPDDVEHELDHALGVLAKRAGFELLHHRLDLVGVCSSCR